MVMVEVYLMLVEELTGKSVIIDCSSIMKYGGI